MPGGRRPGINALFTRNTQKLFLSMENPLFIVFRIFRPALGQI